METPGTERNRKPNVHMLFRSGSVSALLGEARHPLFISHKQGKEAFNFALRFTFSDVYTRARAEEWLRG